MTALPLPLTHRDSDVAAIRPQQAGILDIAVDDQPAAAGRLERSGVDDDVCPGIDIE